MTTNNAPQPAMLAMPSPTRIRDAPGPIVDFAELAALAFDEDRSEDVLSRAEIQAAWWDDDDDAAERYTELGGSD